MTRVTAAMRTACAALGGWLATGPAVLAQDGRLAGRLDSATASEVSRVADSVRFAGLPADPLIAVALEGATRRASADRIVAAVREYAAALATARGALGPAAGSDEVVSGAGVVVAGLRPGALADFRRARPAGPLTVPLVVLADLIARGVPPDTAAAALATALGAGARDADLSDLRRTIERDIVAGAKPSAAMSIRLRTMPTSPTPLGRRPRPLGRQAPR